MKHYNAAEVATAGIFAAKFLERKAFTDLGIWSSSTENYYYRRIHNMVANKIMPKIWTVAGMMLKSPQTALYWGSYLMKICADTKSLCMQFESVVTNSSLTFADIQFLEINQEIAAILKLSEIGNVDWQQLLDDIASVPGNFTVETSPPTSRRFTIWEHRWRRQVSTGHQAHSCSRVPSTTFSMAR